MQGAFRQHLRGMRSHQFCRVHELRRLHHSQHVGMPQHAILACEGGVQMQKMVACGIAQCKPVKAAEGVRAALPQDTGRSTRTG